jgi:hypothetical protein
MSGSDTVLANLTSRYGFQVVTQNVSTSQIRVVGRVHPNHRRNWIVGMQHLLLQASRSPWNVDVSRQYFLRGELMVWGWRLIFQHEDVEQVCPAIVAALQGAPRARFEVEEQALPGVTGQRHTMTEGGKGMAPAGTPPLLIRQRAGR